MKYFNTKKELTRHLNDLYELEVINKTDNGLFYQITDSYNYNQYESTDFVRTRFKYGWAVKVANHYTPGINNPDDVAVELCAAEDEEGKFSLLIKK